MKRSLFTTIGLAFLIVMVGSFVLFASPAIAQDTNPTPTPSTELTSTPENAVSEAGDLPALKGREAIVLITIVLAVAAFLWVILFNYTRGIQEKYFETAIKLAEGGASVTPSIIGTSPTVTILSEPPASLCIEGPESVLVGRASEYKATNETGKPQPVSWSVHPTSAAAINPASDGSSVKVVAALAGVFTLIANVNNNGPKASINLAALVPDVKKVELPVFGWGYGSIAIVIVVLAIVLILGLSEILESAAIATLLGALVGYLFSYRPSGSNTSTTPSNSAGSDQENQ